MIRRILITLLIFSAFLYAEPINPESSKIDNSEGARIEKLEKTVSKIIGKAGIHFSGEFRSQFLYSKVKGDTSASDTTSVHGTRRSDEGVEYTSLDLDIVARPHSAASGRLILRLHQDWRNFFGALKSPISARWISMDGVVADMFRYNVGDFKQKYSPLFLWSPDVEIDYEPEIFAKYKRMVEAEDFIGENNRIMQGVNLNFDAVMDPVFDEFHFNVLGARLRASGVRPEAGGNAVVGELEAFRFDKYLLGVNTDMVIVPDLNVGLTFMDIWDDVNSYSGNAVSDLDDLDSMRQRTFVLGGRLTAGTAPFIDPKDLNIKIDGEFALSIDDSTYLYEDTVANIKINSSEQITDIALRAGADISVGLDGADGKFTFSGDFIMNGADFRNDLAQSPTFIGNSRIMNVENDLATGSLYSTFDALYRHVYKFSPSKDLGDKANNGFYKVPSRKYGYTNTVYTQTEMDTLALYDTIAPFNQAMPNGAATPNRLGADVDVDFHLLDKAVKISGDFGFYNTMEKLEATIVDSLYKNDQRFIEFGGGASIDLGSLGSWWKYPFILSGGYMGSILTNVDVENDLIPNWQNTKVHFINAGLYWTFWKRASLLGGVQILNSNHSVGTALDHDFNQLHWAAGLEWKITENGSLTGSFGKIDLEFNQNDGTKAIKNDYYQTDLYLTVNF